MRISAATGLAIALLGGIATAHASNCPGNPGALGTSRVLKIDPREYPRIGTVQYQETLPLNDKEVVLTFDDGPLPPYTNRVLETLAHECVKANYFIVGRMARGYPELLRRIAAEGHVIGTHSENHPLAFEKMPLRAVQQEIDQGFASATAALGGQGTVAPFFRIPGLLRADTVEGYLRSRSMVTWSADIVADDWKHITASEVVSRSLARLDARGKGILLLHDIQPATALALPHLLRELKRRGYKIVQVVPESAEAMVAHSAPRPRQAAPAAMAAAAPDVTPPQINPQANPQAKPQPRETSSWPTPYPAHSPARATAAATATATATAPTAPAHAEPPVQTPKVTVTVTRTVSPAPALPVVKPNEAALGAIVSELTGAQVRATQGPLDPSALPAGRAMPVPIIEAARLAPGRAPASASPAAAALARPLTPSFKPSHSAALPAKVPELPAETKITAPSPPPGPAPAQQAQPVPAQPSTAQGAQAQDSQAQDVPAAAPQAQDTPASGEAPDAAPLASEPPAAPPERQVDTWSNRASLAPPPRHGAWPVTAYSIGPRPR